MLSMKNNLGALVALGFRPCNDDPLPTRVLTGDLLLVLGRMHWCFHIASSRSCFEKLLSG